MMTDKKSYFLGLIVALLFLLASTGSANAVTQTIHTQNFEAGAGAYTADTPVWEVGSPTAGPGGCHSGTQCAGTVLNGNYPAYSSTRLITPDIILPNVFGAEELQLRFWEWFSYSSYDSGTVQISVLDPVNGWSGFTSIAGTQITNTSNLWTNRSVDLTDYSGSTVRIGFLHSAGRNVFGDASESTGWYIDDIEIRQNVPVYDGTFETGHRDSYASAGVWEVGSPTAGPGACHSGTQCAGTVLNGNYPAYNSTRLVLPTITLPAVFGDEELQLRFWEWFSYSAHDSGTVQVSVLDPVNGWSGFTSIAGTQITNTSNLWTNRSVDLTDYSGSTVRIGFLHSAGRNVFGDASESTGWYIDDIEIRQNVPVYDGTFETGHRDSYAKRGVWEVGAPSATVGPGGCHSGTQCAGTVLNGNYPAYNSTRLVLPTMILPPIAGGEVITFSFWEWFSYSSYDSGTVQISQFIPGTGWSAFTPIAGTQVVGVLNLWTSKSIDLTAYAGSTVRIGFLHSAGRNVFGDASESSGWYIDDITLQGPPTPPVLSFSPEADFSSDGVNPDAGRVETLFTYKTVYSDTWNDVPSYVNVYIDGIPVSMSLDTGCGSLCDGDYTNGEQFVYTTALSLGVHDYYFTASDGIDTVRLPVAGSITGPNVTDLLLSTISLSDGSVGAPYSQFLSATGGVEPYTWSSLGLPLGLSLIPATGEIAGTPTTESLYGFTAEVTDSTSATVPKPLTIDIGPEITLIPDLTISSLVSSPVSPIAGDLVTLRAVVINDGNTQSAPSTLELGINNEVFPQTYQIPALVPGTTYMVERQVTLISAGAYNITATADINDVVFEWDETNNQSALVLNVVSAIQPILGSSLTAQLITSLNCSDLTADIALGADVATQDMVKVQLVDQGGAVVESAFVQALPSSVVQVGNINACGLVDGIIGLHAVFERSGVLLPSVQGDTVTKNATSPLPSPVLDALPSQTFSKVLTVCGTSRESTQVSIDGGAYAVSTTLDNLTINFCVDVPLRIGAENTLIATAVDLLAADPKPSASSEAVKVQQFDPSDIVDFSISSSPLTTDEIETLVQNGVISRDEADNFNVSMFTIVFTIGAFPTSVTFTDYFVLPPVTSPGTVFYGKGSSSGTSGWSSSGCTSGCVQSIVITTSEYNGQGTTGTIPGVIIIDGRIKTLKEFFHVTLALKNISSGFTLSGTESTITLPAGLTPINAGTGTDVGTINTGGVVDTVVLGDILPGDLATGQFIVRGDGIGVHDVVVDFAGTVTAPNTQGIPISGSASTTLEVLGPPELGVVVRHPSHINAPDVTLNEIYNLIVEITNNSDRPAHYTSLELFVGGGAILVDEFGDPLAQSNKIVSFGHIQPGDTVTTAFRVLSQLEGEIIACQAITATNIKLTIDTGPDGTACSISNMYPPNFEPYPPDQAPVIIGNNPVDNEVNVPVTSSIVTVFSPQTNCLTPDTWTNIVTAPIDPFNLSKGYQVISADLVQAGTYYLEELDPFGKAVKHIPTDLTIEHPPAGGTTIAVLRLGLANPLTQYFLKPNTKYRVTVKGGIGGTCSLTSGSEMPDDYQWEFYTGAIELCDGVDNNGDGTVDEGFPNLDTACSSGVGECAANGTFVCTADGTGTECSAVEGTGTAETCDGTDNDCNGLIDDGLTTDADSDGYTSVGSCEGSGDDCNDADFDIKPGAVELCDGIDNNCDGAIDDGLTTDIDGDGYTALGSCGGTGDDCNDVDFDINPGATEICDNTDNDCSGFVDDGIADQVVGIDIGECQAEITSCVNGAFQIVQAGISPIPELCDGSDNNCDGLIDEAFPDLDATCGAGLGECSASGIFICTADGAGTECNAVAGTATAEACDGVDNDCNGQVDDGIADQTTGTDVGECQAEITSCVNGAFQIVQSGIGPFAESCDALDNDCNGQVDDGLIDQVTGTDVGECQSEITSCVNGVNQIIQTGVGPSSELCDGLDNNCDGSTDESFLDLNATCSNGTGECSASGVLICTADGAGTECNAVAGTAIAEVCDGVDNDCNGSIDDGLIDQVTGTDVGECQSEITSCVDGVNQIIQTGVGPTAELCDGLDNNCDGFADESFLDLNAACSSGVGECSASGVLICTADGAGTECNAVPGTGTAEVCDGVDNDCNGQADDGIADQSTGINVGECQSEITSCLNGAFQIVQTSIGPTAELCDGLDNNCDGSTDESFLDLNAACGSGVGECSASGVLICTADGAGTECNAVAGAGTVEICDGVDNDCNGSVDDGIADQSTGSNVGECQSEITSCVNGAFQIVQTGIGPTAELCDGLDNDCNNLIDDGVSNKVIGTDIGVCQPEIQSCVDAGYVVIQQGVTPATEILNNGIDENCDGTDGILVDDEDDDDEDDDDEDDESSSSGSSS